ncbi:HEAT repeat-containing protein [Babesia caballi]|uniref:HEAT repeat-containing protein n=1 Tax=Babesia caballi TaxID=5871 RepID=A0AAV4LW81_BABCB|nr:HEAT repeat-containing protein [Babesia caballi]
MSLAGNPAYAQLLSVLEKSDRPDTQTQKDVADFIAQFESSNPYGVLYFLEAALTTSALHVRQMAALCMKRTINLRWASLEPDVKAHLKSGLVRGIQIDDSDVRTTFGSSFVALFTVEGYDHWPEAPGLLLNLVTESPNDVVRDTAGSTLLMLVEDMTSKEPRSDGTALSDVASDRFANFVVKELIPRVLELGTQSAGSVVFSCKMLLTLMEGQLGTKVLFEERFPAFWALLGAVAQNGDPAVRKCVLKGMAETWTRQPNAILDASAAVFGFVTDCTADASDTTVQLEAMYFWAHLLRNRLEESIRVRLVDSFRLHLPRLIPILMENTQYTSWDYMSMDESHLEEDNAAVPDRVEDVPPRPEGEMTDGEDDESATWGTNWTVRKGAALALDHISQIFGHDKEILQFMLELIEKRLANEADWEVRESAVLVLGAISRGCALAMEPYLPKVVQYLIDLTCHRKPLMRSIACWCLSRFAGWSCQWQSEEQEAHGLQPVLNAVLARVLDRNKRVQEAACSALASFIEEAGNSLLPHLELIAETLVKAFGFYQARNLMILYEAVGTVAEVFGEELPQSPFGAFIMQPVMQRLATTDVHTPQFLALMDCVTSLVQCWESMYAAYAEVTIRRAMTAVFEVLYDSKTFEATDGATDVPRWDVIGCSLEVIWTVVGVLRDQAPPLVEQASIVLEARIAKDMNLERPQVGMGDMLTLCCQCPVPCVLQSTFALVGDLALHCTSLVATDAMIACLSFHAMSATGSVSNNVCWALGMLAQTPLGQQRLEPYFHEVALKLVELVNRDNEHVLMQNVCITLGRFATAFPAKTAPLLPRFVKPWLDYIVRTRTDREKALALAGVATAACLNGEVPGDALVALTRIILEFPPWCPELERLAAERREPLQHRGVGERRGVPEVVALVAHELAQDAAHDLAAARLGQVRRRGDDIGGREGAHVLAHGEAELAHQLVARAAEGVLERHEAEDGLALDGVREGDGRGLRDDGHLHQRVLDVGGADAMPGDVERVVHPAVDPEVAVPVAVGGVAGEVAAGHLGEVRRHAALVAAEERAEEPRPRAAEREQALGVVLCDLPAGLRVDQDRVDAEEGHRVDDGRAAAADDVVVPAPRLRVDGLADAAQDAQRGHVELPRDVVPAAHEPADRRRRGVELRDAVLLDHAPVAAGIGVVWQRGEDEGREAVEQRAVHDVGVPGDPPDVGHAAEDVPLLRVKDVLCRRKGVEQVARGRVRHALRPSGRPGRVENE